ncbi:patellin-4 [Syzygium oleosum]|uniref:patellin-4 n=1 Tax=Syzygium oleosum TaxID=219896 RepID=UPI0011D1EA0D|nr:patellin-4 [Syzygium oleosum]
MTVEHVAATQMAADVVAPQDEAKKVVEETKEVIDQCHQAARVPEDEAAAEPKAVEKSSSYREESYFLSDLKECERKALSELRSKLEDAILGNALFEKPEEKKKSKKEEAPCDENAEKEKEAEKAPCDEEAEKEEGGGDGEEAKQEEEKKEEEEGKCVEVDREIALWGVPLLPSKGAEETNVVLLKFLRAREFKVNEAFEMLKKTLRWRKESGADAALGEGFDPELSSAAYWDGSDREGHPVCYNVYGVFRDEGLYRKAFGTEENRDRFLRWRVQLMEQGIKKLDMKPGGVSSMLQINDLKNSPGPTKKDLRITTQRAIDLLQDNYPELVARNIFIHVPFWYYALNALVSPFLTQRTKSKFVVARPGKVTKTLLKYIPAAELPVQYGGFKREKDFEFSSEDGSVSELTVKAGSTETIELPIEETGSTLLWDLTVMGWEVSYKEEFVPSDEGSYTVIVRKGKKMAPNQGPIRNTFRNNEPGKVVLTIENVSTKKKRILYRYKNKKCSSF